jgi:hypothetical protein
VKRGIEIGLLLCALAALLLLRNAGGDNTISTYSTYDNGPNGYEALFNVLRSEGVAVTRYTGRLNELPAGVHVFATAPGAPYDASDEKRLQALIARGVRVVAFRASRESFPKGTVALDADRFTNGALDRRPQNILQAYRALAGRGAAVFDERRQGFGTDRTIWSVLPLPVKAGAILAALALLLALIGFNVRLAPAVAPEPPADRDSSAYIESMAQLLRRARAAHVMRKETP